MAEELNIHVVGSYTRTSSMMTFFSARYRIVLEAKVMDADGSPVEGLSAEDFTIRLAGFDSDLGAFIFLPFPDNIRFPGFYQFVIERTSGGFFDIYATAGLLFCIRVDHEGKFATTAINLTQIVV
jgi:hypothetical protein